MLDDDRCCGPHVMTIRITGMQRHFQANADRRKQMQENVTLAMIEYAGLIQTIASDSIKEHGIPSPNHIVSAPGEPPNADTHDLDLSIHARFQGEDADAAITGIGGEEAGLETRVTIEVVAGGPTAPYAPGLEVGTATIAARPFMGPASQKARAPGQAIIQRAIVKTQARGPNGRFISDRG